MKPSVIKEQQRRIEILRELVTDERGKRNVAAFARRYGLDDSYLRQILNGHSPFGEKAAQKMGIDISGDPDFFVKRIRARFGHDESEESRENSPYQFGRLPITVSIPLIEWESVMLADRKAAAVGELSVVLAKQRDTQECFALPVIGTVMAPAFVDGDVILVDPGCPPKHGSVVVCSRDGSVMLRNLECTPEGQFLLALAPDHPQRRTAVDERTTIHGVVFQLIRHIGD